jgi:hypothetical protein
LPIAGCEDPKCNKRNEKPKPKKKLRPGPSRQR